MPVSFWKWKGLDGVSSQLIYQTPIVQHEIFKCTQNVDSGSDSC